MFVIKELPSASLLIPYPSIIITHYHSTTVITKDYPLATNAYECPLSHAEDLVVFQITSFLPALETDSACL